MMSFIIFIVVIFGGLGYGAMKFEKWKAKQIAKEIKKKDTEPNN